MKNLKKIIILSIIIIITVSYIIYNYTNDSEGEFIENIYVETNNNIEQKNKIILHITGEVNNPRNNSNR